MLVIHVGFGNYVAAGRVIGITPLNSAPIKRMISECRKLGMVIDTTNGRKTKTVITTDSGHVILAAIEPETIAGRIRQSESSSKNL
jgi:regulator of extracellular matrix RemA (YlzA/DUF370 family)